MKNIVTFFASTGTITRAGMVLIALGASGCANPASTGSNSVSQAYNASGVITIPPYTRTIFSTTNF